MNWLQRILLALHYEPEVWAAYLLGQMFNERASGIPPKPRYSGLPLRLVAYTRELIRSVRFKLSAREHPSVDVLVIAQTANQASSLATTVKHLRSQGVSVHAVTSGHSAITILERFACDEHEWITLSPVGVLKVALLTIIRTPVIWWHLAGKDQRLGQWFLDEFLRCHIYLVYFDKKLATINPRLILVSNDHNTPQRCLLALARVKGIKTAYLQHASVSQLFPALVFDYSLLDGEKAMHTYIKCESNKPDIAAKPNQRHLFLTGQKKSIHRSKEVSSNTVGLAIKPLDNMQDVMKIATAISQAGYPVLLRWHPAMSREKADEFRKACSSNPSVTFSEPLLEPVGNFLAQLVVLVAANSSIHLEAAVAGLVPIYFEISPVSTRDYYGFVKNGLSAEAKDIDAIIHLIGEVIAGHRKIDSIAVQTYSATYDTEWEGREGELAGSIIKDLLDGIEPADCWGYAGVLGSVISQKIDAMESQESRN
ncbi:hypothetical protein [Cyanobium sp. FACHB-13342]|uniref:hypothetical protein n=1 Tax=Cyanobium sp. FACHB-13342 TaxID=2692793 RepID=UPI00168035AC|nr:hypothetical protein [Cyanobium sp. FACHB-13342]MBD2422487.1 hypothetical protein [Cyanobium sp. FACHB-13342]